MRLQRTALLAGLLIPAFALPALAQQSPGSAQRGAGTTRTDPNALAEQTRVVEMKDAQGNLVGTVQVRPTAHGTLFSVSLMNLPPGGHGFHVHERGLCEPPNFQSAGEHLNPTGAQHGYDNQQGPHVGDLPNLFANEEGQALAEFYSEHLTLRPQQTAKSGQQTTGQASGGNAAGPFTLLTQAGTAIVVHANPDDYRNMASAGGRIACGVIKPPS